MFLMRLFFSNSVIWNYGCCALLNRNSWSTRFCKWCFTKNSLPHCGFVFGKQGPIP